MFILSHIFKILSICNKVILCFGVLSLLNNGKCVALLHQTEALYLGDDLPGRTDFAGGETLGKNKLAPGGVYPET